MGNSIKIICRGLSPETVQRLDGATEAVLDLTPGFSFRFSKDVEKLSILQKISTEGVLGFDLPFSFTNDAVFVDFESPLALDQNRGSIAVSVLVEGHEILFDRLQITGRDQRSKKWNCQLFRRDDHWVELAQTKMLNSIQTGYFFLTKANVERSWGDHVYSGDFTPTPEVGTGYNPNVHWPLLDFGNWVDQTVPLQNTNSLRCKSVSTEDFRPLISIVYLLKRGFCEIGWTLDGQIFDTVWFKSLWAYLLKPDFYLGTSNGYKYGRAGRITGRHVGPRYEMKTFTDVLRFDTLEFGLGTSPLAFHPPVITAWWLMGLKSQLPFKSKYKFKFKFTVTNENPNTAPLVFQIGEVLGSDPDNSSFTGEVLSEDFVIEVAAGETLFINFELDALVEGGQKAALIWANPEINIFMEPGLFFECEPDNKSFTRSDFVDTGKAIIPELTLMQLFKGVIHLTRGLIETDWETRTVTVHPQRTSTLYGEIVPGFLKVESPPKDFDQKIVCDSIKEIPQRGTLKRYTRLEFAQAGDAYIKQFNLVDPAHSRTLLNGVELPNETTVFPNPIFEPTFDAQTRFIKQRGREVMPYIPRLWDNVGDERSFDIGPRIFFSFGKIKQLYPTPLTGAQKYVGWYWDGKEIGDFEQFFGYATQLRQWEIEPTPPVDGSVVFGRVEDDLFVNFYLGLTGESRRGVTLDALVMLTFDDYNQTDFRDMYSFTYLGRPFIVPMTEIRDFAAGLNAPTPVKFLSAPVDSECCELPCGCKFKTCDFYQDFGTYILQDTLNDLKVTSFKVDDVELLVDPVSLGTINIIDIAGRPYVTNLVDALNSIAAPYFAFGYSTRVHPEKGLRYFSLKCPACFGFEIIISDLADEVYRYTNTEQGTQWFGGVGWQPFGYGSQFHTTPIDCIITNEY